MTTAEVILIVGGTLAFGWRADRAEAQRERTRRERTQTLPAVAPMLALGWPSEDAQLAIVVACGVAWIAVAIAAVRRAARDEPPPWVQAGHRRRRAGVAAIFRRNLNRRGEK